MAIDFMNASSAGDVLRVYWKARARQHLHFLLRCGCFCPEAAAALGSLQWFSVHNEEPPVPGIRGLKQGE